MGDPNPPPRPGNYERSWNDPPLFSYGSTTQNLEQARKQGANKLNKRVEFPSSNASSNTMPAMYPVYSEMANCPPMYPSQNCPPMYPSPNGPPMYPSPNCPPMYVPPSSTPHELPPPPTESLVGQSLINTETSKPLQILPYDYKNTSNPNKSLATCDNEEQEIDANYPVVEAVAGDFDKVLEIITPNIDKKKFNDVKKRLDMMISKWKSGAFNSQIHKGMERMSKCLLTALGNVDDLLLPSDEGKSDIKAAMDEAETIQTKLMVDWPSLCGTWMVGIKHLVHEIRSILTTNGQLEESKDGKGIDMPL